MVGEQEALMVIIMVIKVPIEKYEKPVRAPCRIMVIIVMILVIMVITMVIKVIKEKDEEPVRAPCRGNRRS